MSKEITKSLIGYKPINDRILTIRLLGQVKNITLIQVYAPTSASTEEDLESFYSTLQKEIDSKESKDILIISGDFNAKVSRKKNSDEDGIIGNFGLGERNKRGDTMVDFAIENQLAIKNTMYQKHPRRLYTWTSPDTKTRNQIDYILIEKRWASTIQNVITKPNADCDTDHKLLVATLKLKLKCKKNGARPIRYNVKDISENFKIEIKNRLKHSLAILKRRNQRKLQMR